MSDLLVIEFPSEEKAEGVREILLAMQQEYLIELGDAVIAVKEANGRLKLNQLFQPVTQDAASGKLWRSLIGLLFMIPVAGAASSAAPGTAGRKLADLGIDDTFMTQAARTVQSGNAALFLLIRKMTTDKVVAALRGAGGTVMRSSFDETKEQALHAALAYLQAVTAEPASEFLPAPQCAVGERETDMLFPGGFTFSNFLADVLSVFIFILWFWLLITVCGDLFRRHDVSGWGKAFWVIALIVFPYLGIFIYLITQGRGMAQRQHQRVEQAREADAPSCWFQRRRRA